MHILLLFNALCCCRHFIFLLRLFVSSVYAVCTETNRFLSRCFFILHNWIPSTGSKPDVIICLLNVVTFPKSDTVIVISPFAISVASELTEQEPKLLSLAFGTLLAEKCILIYVMSLTSKTSPRKKYGYFP